MTLTLEQVELLRAPMPLETGHSMRVKGEAPQDAQRQWAHWLVYTEEEPVIDRLNEIDLNWSLEITDKVISKDGATVYGRLTVGGVTRDCVGSGTGGDAEKGAATDMLKRGARLFGVGLYLKNAPQIYTGWEKKNVRTRAQEAEFEREAFAQFAKWYRQQFAAPHDPETGEVTRAPAPPRLTDTPEAPRQAVANHWWRVEQAMTKFCGWARNDVWGGDVLPWPRVYRRIGYALGLPEPGKITNRDELVMAMDNGNVPDKAETMKLIQAYEPQTEQPAAEPA